MDGGWGQTEKEGCRERRGGGQRERGAERGGHGGWVGAEGGHRERGAKGGGSKNGGIERLGGGHAERGGIEGGGHRGGGA